MLHEFFYPKDEAKIDKKIVYRLFKTNKKKFKKYDSIQATLPYLKLAWVKEIREVNLKLNDFNYNPKEKV